MDLKLRTWSDTTDIRFPEDFIFIARTFGVHFGNLSSLRASGPWRDLALEYAGRAAMSLSGGSDMMTADDRRV